MLLDDNVVTQRETKTRSLAGWFGREERIEPFFPHDAQNHLDGLGDRPYRQRDDQDFIVDEGLKRIFHGNFGGKCLEIDALLGLNS